VRLEEEEIVPVPTVNDEALRKEHYEILNIVGEFDTRLLTVKGWGVTLSFAALGWGFQYAHYGPFVVAALSGFGFWPIEGLMKQHQMRQQHPSFVQHGLHAKRQ
jgi:hypothetical protein